MFRTEKYGIVIKYPGYHSERERNTYILISRHSEKAQIKVDAGVSLLGLSLRLSSGVRE